MKIQSYKNHIRFYPAHHFVYYPVVSIFLGFSIYFACTSKDSLIWIFISAILVLLFALGLMMRQHYALLLQDRIVRLELRYRYFTLTGKRFEESESQLNDSQLFALRFCSDNELEALTNRAIVENLDANMIKKAIKNWRGDYDRV